MTKPKTAYEKLISESTRYMYEEVSPMEYYIKWSSIFDNTDNKYDIELFSDALKNAGATEVWTDNAYGWSNQPEVVLFKGISKEEAEDALKKLPVFKGGVIIGEVDVDWDKPEE